MVKIAINKNPDGEFSLSPAAILEYAKRKGFSLWAYVNVDQDENGQIDYEKYVQYTPNDDRFNDYRVHYFTKPLENNIWDGRNNETCYQPWYIERNDPVLIDILETMGEKAILQHICTLKIVEIPDDVKWSLGYDEYVGEKVVELHREWK